MSKIDLNCLELDDSDLSLNDVTPMCSFLSSKEVNVIKFRDAVCVHICYITINISDVYPRYRLRPHCPSRL